ncbi:uncharacterized protein LOC127751788 [Frankliniella occidentalis]|uniref:Uncharacterized protein LOC127751788 n=1 Tax=Frankliniella occidentalis TaxID=133901 RepID=A0A9C6X9M2_FRAOC|nr:uncharacterized protein LOC127751788 [Frankliniella occidentalis]
MATTFTTASPMAAVTAALLLAVAISSPTAVFADKSSESSEGADSKENRSSVSARQLFGFGTGRPGLPGLFGSSPFGFGNNGFPFGGGNPFFNGLPDGGGGSGQFNNNPFLNGQTGNAPFHNNNPSISGDPSGNPYPTNVPTSGASGGPVRPRPDQTGNQYNTGRPFGSGGVQNGNQYTTSRPFGSGGAQNDNQYNSGRPFGSGDVQNGNQYTTSRPVLRTQKEHSTCMHRPTIVCCPLLPEDCGPNNTSDRIISSAGHQTSLEEFPWVVRLGYRSAGSGEITYHCAGSLISNRFVLTAAHCVQQKEPSVVRLGEYDTMTDPDTEPIFSHSAPRSTCSWIGSSSTPATTRRRTCWMT